MSRLIPIRLYCRCGVQLIGHAFSEGAAAISADFWRSHSGPGHSSCSPRVCRNTRQRAEAGAEKRLIEAANAAARKTQKAEGGKQKPPREASRVAPSETGE